MLREIEGHSLHICTESGPGVILVIFLSLTLSHMNTSKADLLEFERQDGVWKVKQMYNEKTLNLLSGFASY